MVTHLLEDVVKHFGHAVPFSQYIKKSLSCDPQLTI